MKQFELWIADLNPKIGTEPGKIRPVVIVQTDLINKIPHPSTIVCPITTNIQPESKILRIHLRKDVANVFQDCDIMVDQFRAIDNKRFIKKIGSLPSQIANKLKENIKIVMDLE